MRIDNELLTKAGKVAVERGVKQTEEEAKEEVLSLNDFTELKKVIVLALFELAKGTPAHIVFGTVYQLGFGTGYAYRELEVGEGSADTPQSKEATAG